MDERNLSLIGLAIGIILLIISTWLLKLNKKKGYISLVLSIIYLGVIFYYIYLGVFVKMQMPFEIKFTPLVPDLYKKNQIPSTKETKESNIGIGENIFEEIKKETEIIKEKEIPKLVSVILEVDSKETIVTSGDEIQIAQNAKFIIKDIKTSPPTKNVKANMVGFIGNPKVNDGQDIGYLISYEKLDKKHSIDKEGNRYKINIDCEGNNIGTIYINFKPE